MKLTKEQKISIALKKKWATDVAYRNVMRNKWKGKKHKESSLVKMIDSQKKRWQNIRKDPVAYRKMIENMSKNNAKNMLGKTGSLSPSWKGGRITSKRDGYISVLAPENHPYGKFGGGGKKSKYILEHRLIMEKVLGRYLFPDEDVNHINGKKDDNRPENLMLVRHYAHYEKMRCPKCEFIFLTR